jgi:hypothetical protein
MSNDINNFFVSGIVDKMTHDNKGFASITVISNKTTQTKSQVFTIPVIVWGEKAADIKQGDYVIANGYVNARMVERKDGSGSFPSLSLVASSINKIRISKPSDPQQSSLDEEIPF